ncbi:NADPH:quinone oxidoreductase family protein [Lipingzhangella sp. LS1_29]|uniref:NADPH:quinone oxidoreductase family protein n=1 Tax=Lipingzhangella rawalii TaxID=2055835 RepID=A0ABU2H895_9ACTN|nr:NADPH:quinone oxidoreductase family protein [Lipingzhangella rawalii]MDS1271531.1 NADPH:quinone oxidoreductase family protein [Lipingzhangella rawalii]
MKAWQVHELGEPAQVLQLADIPAPAPAPGQLRVRVRAAAANFPDALLCRGHYQVRPDLPFTPGVELVGEVSALGEGVTGFAEGDRVIGSPELPAGAFAEESLLRADQVLPAPTALDDAQASAFFIGYQTGWFALHRRAALQSGETLLVHAAAGGVGSAAVQLGKAAGATVIGVVGSPDKAEVARQLGADMVIDRTREDVVATVKEATAGRGADVVFDPVGGDAYTWSTKCIAFEGRIVVIGFASGTIPTPALGHPLVKNYSILGLHWGLYQHRDPKAIRYAHDELSTLAADGIVRPLVTARRGLDDVPDAVQQLADGTTAGRVSIEVTR